MSTFTNTTKNSVTALNTDKNISTFANTPNSHGLYYILTDILDYVMVGSSEDEYLIWDEPTSYTNLVKS